MAMGITTTNIQVIKLNGLKHIYQAYWGGVAKIGQIKQLQTVSEI